MIQEMLSYSPAHIFQHAKYYYWDNAIKFAYSKRQLGMHDFTREASWEDYMILLFHVG